MNEIVFSCSGKPFHEVVEWLAIDPIPWSRRKPTAANCEYRGRLENLWNIWDVEYPKDLYSLVGNIHQISLK